MLQSGISKLQLKTFTTIAFLTALLVLGILLSLDVYSGEKVLGEKGITLVDEYLIEDTESEFSGVTLCQDCHVREFNHWQKTKHATSWKHVEKEVIDERNEDCIRCHVTGYGIRTGFKDLKSSPHLTNVQCEACHGPGGTHIASIKRNSKDPQYGCQSCLIKEKCIQCHTRQRDEDFDFQRDYSRIKHTDEKAAD